MRLREMRMRGHDTHTKGVGAAFARGNETLVNVMAVAFVMRVLN